jgi:hypothetical protein
LTGIIVAAVVCGLAMRRMPAHRPGRRSWWRHPWAWLVAVTAVIYLNQVLFTVYVLRAHGGSAAFVARYLPGGWFTMADHDPVLRRLAAHLAGGQRSPGAADHCRLRRRGPLTAASQRLVVRLHIGQRVPTRSWPASSPTPPPS